MKLSELKIDVDTSELDVATEKANRLVQLLREAETIINSLSDKEIQLETKFTCKV